MIAPAGPLKIRPIGNQRMFVEEDCPCCELLKVRTQKTRGLFDLTECSGFVNRFGLQLHSKLPLQTGRPMAKKKLTRKELLKRPDEFLTFSNKVANFLTTHSTLFRYFGLVVAVLAIAYLGGHMYIRHINNKGQDAYNTAYYTFTRNMADDLGPEDLQKPGELFEKVVDEYGLSKAARLALPQIAFVKFLAGEYDEAIDLYRRFSEKVSGETQYESLTNLALAACYESKGDLNRAIETLDFIVGTPDHSFNETAMLSLARLYRIKNDNEKAKQILELFVEEHPSSPFLPMAKAHLSIQ